MRGTVNGVAAEFLVDAGATGAAAPHALARGLGLKRGISDPVLLGMSFLRHFELSPRGRSLTVHASANR